MCSPDLCQQSWLSLSWLKMRQLFEAPASNEGPCVRGESLKWLLLLLLFDSMAGSLKWETRNEHISAIMSTDLNPKSIRLVLNCTVPNHPAQLDSISPKWERCNGKDWRRVRPGRQLGTRYVIRQCRVDAHLLSVPTYETQLTWPLYYHLLPVMAKSTTAHL